MLLAKEFKIELKYEFDGNGIILSKEDKKKELYWWYERIIWTWNMSKLRTVITLSIDMSRNWFSFRKYEKYLCIVRDVLNSLCALHTVHASDDIELDMFDYPYHKPLLLLIHCIQLILLCNWTSASANNGIKHTIVFVNKLRFSRISIVIVLTRERERERESDASYS